PSPGVLWVAWIADGRRILTAESDGTYRVWDAESGRERRNFGRFSEYIIAPPVVSPDGRLVAATGRADGGGGWQIRVWELATGTVRREFAGHRDAAAALAFSPDGRTLATGGRDTTVLLWNLTGPQSGRPAAPRPDDLPGLWQTLGDADAARAFAALAALADAPQRSLSLVREGLRPAPPPPPPDDPDRIARLVADLEDPKFATRDRARAELERLGAQARPALEAALKKQPPPELRNRVAALLGRLDREDSTPE